MLKRLTAILAWLLNLFDPPPLVSMTLTQKVGRVLLLSGTLVVGSVLVAMIGALGLYLMEKGRELGNTPEFFQGVLIIVTGIIVNTVCVLVLIQFKNADHKLIPPTRPRPVSVEPIGHIKVTVDDPKS
jgi:uncharacterized membrane protein YidH (DUF202 family)